MGAPGGGWEEEGDPVPIRGSWVSASGTEFALVAVVGSASSSRGAVGIGVRGVVALPVTVAFLLALWGPVVAVLALAVGLLLALVGLVA